MPTDDRVIIKGVRDGLLILPAADGEWAELLVELEEHLSARRAFFQGATVTVNLGTRALTEPEFAALRGLLDKLEMALDVVVSTSAETRAVAGASGVRTRAPAFAPRSSSGRDTGDALQRHRRRKSDLLRRGPEPESPPSFEGEPNFGALAGEDNSPAAEADWAAGAPGAVFLRRTLRSGMRIYHDGDVCILGDVNPGAEIVAGGDVVVWGAVRGMVHAGAGGDSAAVVCALLLAPTQLRISELVTRGSAPSGPPAPEQARISDGRIVVEPWSARRR
ncbi:MAG: septum site-determining protein MinC [Chloroflexia bacterium]